MKQRNKSGLCSSELLKQIRPHRILLHDDFYLTHCEILTKNPQIFFKYGKTGNDILWVSEGVCGQFLLVQQSRSDEKNFRGKLFKL